MIRPSPELLRRITADLPDEDFQEMAVPSYLHSNPLMRWMAWRRLEVVAGRLARLCAGRTPRVLDFGCGAGVLLEETLRHGATVLASDLVLEPARRLARERGLRNVTFIDPDRLAAEVPEASLDVIVAAEVLEHVDPLAPALTVLRSLLRPNGTLLTSLPTENAVYQMGRRFAGFSGHYHHANAFTVDAEIQRSGFRRGWHTSIPAPGPLAIFAISEYVPG